MYMMHARCGGRVRIRIVDKRELVCNYDSSWRTLQLYLPR